MKVSVSGFRELQSQLKQLQQRFPDEVKAMIFEVALVDVETYAKDETGIPVDTGRLRASIHTKYLRKPKKPINTGSADKSVDHSQMTYIYKDDEGNTFDGTLTPQPDEYSVIVGTNVKYAKKINRQGGGGANSRRKLPKGQGQAFFDKAINNGKIALRRELKQLAKRLHKIP